MNLNAKDETRQMLARDGEATPSEPMRPKPVAVALAEIEKLAPTHESPDEKPGNGAQSRPKASGRTAAAKPPSSLLDYRLVRVSSRLDGPEFQNDDLPKLAGEKPIAASNADSPLLDPDAHVPVATRRLAQGAAVLLTVSVVVIFVIGAMLVL